MKLLLDYEETRKLPDIQMVDFERYGYERAFPMLLDALPARTLSVLAAAPSTAEVDPVNILNPFKGLEAFQQTDAHLFFGREALVQKLLKHLSDERADRFLAITGASGSGKSSLVRAGLIPKIRASSLPESASWPLVIFAPGPLPTDALSQRLLPVISSYGLPTSALDILKIRDVGLHVITESVLNEAPRTTRLVLIIDQFEEVFTRAKTVDAAHFLDLVVTAATETDGRTLIVLTMRADFFDRLSGYPKLAALFEQDNLVIATEMLPDELRRSIEGPAEAVGLAYEHGLVDTILEDVRQQPGSLPLLQYALKQLFEARQGRWLKTEAYTTMGGVLGALAGHANGIYDSLSAKQQDLMRRLLVRLIEVSKTGEATRRRVNRSTLTFQGVSSEQVDNIIDVLAAWDNRLLIANRDVTAVSDNVPIMVEISHEALVREWPKLRDWIKADVADLQYGSEILKDAQDWLNHDRDTEFLFQGDRRILEAQLWLERADASDLQRDYVIASIAEVERLKTHKEREQTEKLRMAEAAAASAQRAEHAEIARATRFEWAARIAGGLATIAVIGIIAALLTATDATKRSNQAQNDQGTAVAQAITATVAQGQAVNQLGTATVVQGQALVQVETAQFNSTLSAFEAQRLSTQIPGLGQIPPTPAISIAPLDAFATATQIATAYEHEDDMIKIFDDDVGMLQVPAGCFMMGSGSLSDAVPVTHVCFDKPFWIDIYEVTNEQYKRLTRQTPPSQYKGDKQPVEQINWFDARDYCENARMAARLPTEAEWEYAASGPDSYPYPWGREFPHSKIGDYTVFNQRETTDVGEGVREAGRSWVGAYDMSGNVWEWVSSLYNFYPYKAGDGREADTGNDSTVLRVLRGGSWYSDDADYLRASARNRATADTEYVTYGFRCARSSES